MAMLTFLVCLLPIVASMSKPGIIKNSENYIVNISDNTLLDVRFIGDPDLVLNLSSRNLQALRKNAFSNVRDVESLDLSNNSLIDLYPYTFANLTKLKRLTLVNNSIRSTTNAFIGLKNLQLLDISHNSLTFFVPGSLFGVPHSTRILINSIEPNKRIFYTAMNKYIYAPIYPYLPVNKVDVLSERAMLMSEYHNTHPNTRAKFCISNGTIMWFDIVEKNEELAEGCINADLEIEFFWIVKFLHYTDKGAIIGFQKFWYRAFSLPIGSFMFMNDNITDITEEMLNDLPATVTKVYFDFNPIRKIRSDVIENYHLRMLSFQVNLIEEIEDNAFAKTRLQELNLYGNQLESLNFVFTLPDTIINLNVSGNRVTFIPNNVFSRFPKMSVLDLQSNRIKLLTNDVFSGLPHLTYLSLQNNQIETLESNVFSGLSHLSTLSLQGNKIETLPNNILHNLTSLKTLLLGDNSVTTFEPVVFKGLTALTLLKLAGNSIRDLHVHAFAELTALKSLDLSRNKLIKVPYIYIPRTLDTLYLEYNEISALENKNFVDVPRHDLHLNGNPISSIARGAFNLPTLVELYIEKTNLTTIDGDSYEGLDGLRLLHLSENKISEVRKGSCKNLKNLQKMVLTSNPLQKLESGAFYGLRVNEETTIYFEKSNLKEIQPGLFEDV